MSSSRTNATNVEQHHTIDLGQSSPQRKRKLSYIDPSTQLSSKNLCDNALTYKEKDWGCLRWIEGLQIEHYRTCMFLSSQTLLLSTLRRSYSCSFFLRGVSHRLDTILWIIAIGTLVFLTLGYTLKTLVYMDSAKKEYHNRVSKNYFFAPLISAMLLALSVPPPILDAHNTKTMARSVGVVLVGVMVAMEMKIYGQWFMGGKQLLCKVANPSIHLSIVGNFVGSMLLASKAEWRESAIFLMAIGSVHYLVLFVTLYQRLPTNAALPKHLNPVFFFFLAGPTTATLACEAMCGKFNISCKMPYFLSLFLFMSLVVRMDLKTKFTTAWWDYGFPVTMEAVASVHYSDAMESKVADIMAIVLSVISMVTMLSLVVATLIYYAPFNLFLKSKECCLEIDPAVQLYSGSKKRRVFTV